MDLARKTKRENADLAKRVKLVRQVVSAKLADAAAHASKALTDTVDQTTEGRPTAAKLRASRSYQAALNRLTELHDQLTGLVEKCRVETYSEAYAFWWAYHDPDTRRSASPDPSQANIERCRTTVLHGYTVREFLAGAIGRASTQLLPRLVVSGNRQVGSREAALAIKAWQQTATSTITSNAITALVDSQTLADRRAGRDAIKRDLLHDDPTLND